MEHRKALIDTSIIIDHLRKRDIFIAATAATFNLPIVTLKYREHFERIKKIELLSL